MKEDAMGKTGKTAQRLIAAKQGWAVSKIQVF